MTARDKGHVEEIIKHLKRVENDYNLDLTPEMEWLRGICKKEPASDLKKEIQRHLKECLNVKFPTTDIESIKKDVEYTARHFANWQKEQMMKDAIEVEVKIDAGGYPYIPQIELYDYDNEVFLACEGDKVKVKIIKEDEDGKGE